MAGLVPAMTPSNKATRDMATYKLFLLPGDGIGPEVMAEVEKVAERLRARSAWRGSRPRRAWSAAAPTTRTARRSREADMARAQAADAVLLGRGRRAEMGRRPL